jgi:hypothetical protein
MNSNSGIAAMSEIVRNARAVFPMKDYGLRGMLLSPNSVIKRGRNPGSFALALKSPRRFEGDLAAEIPNRRDCPRSRRFATDREMIAEPLTKPAGSGFKVGRYYPGWDCFEASVFLMRKIRLAGHFAQVVGLKTGIFTHDYAVSAYGNLNKPDSFRAIFSLTPFIGNEYGIVEAQPPQKRYLLFFSREDPVWKCSMPFPDPAILNVSESILDNEADDNFEQRVNYSHNISANIAPYSFETSNGTDIMNSFYLRLPLGKHLEINTVTDIIKNGRIARSISSFYSFPLNLIEEKRAFADIGFNVLLDQPPNIFHVGLGKFFVNRGIYDYHVRIAGEIIPRVIQTIDI